MTTCSTTPSGRRSMPLGLIATQIQTNAFAARSGTTHELVHKQRAFNTLSKARRFFGICDRDLTIIRHALLTFHPETRSGPQKKFSRPRTCSRRAAPTVAVALTDRRKMIEKHPNL
jgi:hypothetical protein